MPKYNVGDVFSITSSMNQIKIERIDGYAGKYRGSYCNIKGTWAEDTITFDAKVSSGVYNLVQPQGLSNVMLNSGSSLQPRVGYSAQPVVPKYPVGTQFSLTNHELHEVTSFDDINLMYYGHNVTTGVSWGEAKATFEDRFNQGYYTIYSMSSPAPATQSNTEIKVGDKYRSKHNTQYEILAVDSNALYLKHDYMGDGVFRTEFYPIANFRAEIADGRVYRVTTEFVPAQSIKAVCNCPIKELTDFGCKCEAGKQSLLKEFPDRIKRGQWV